MTCNQDAVNLLEREKALLQPASIGTLVYTYRKDCGYAADLEARVKVHNDGKGAKYTKGRLPVKVAYSESFATKSEAMRRENEIKRLRHVEKL